MWLYSRNSKLAGYSEPNNKLHQLSKGDKIICLSKYMQKKSDKIQYPLVILKTLYNWEYKITSLIRNRVTTKSQQQAPYLMAKCWKLWDWDQHAGWLLLLFLFSIVLIPISITRQQKKQSLSGLEGK